jgi:outer membrane protein TolC
MLLLLITFALATPPAPATPVHLAGLLAEAREKNPEIRSARAQAHADEAGIGVAAALDDPMLMAQFWNMPVDLSMVPVMVNVTQSLPLGGKRAARRAEATAMADASRASVATRARDIEAAVERAYFDLFLADRARAVDAEIAGTLRALVAAATARLGAGRGEEAEVLRAQSEELKVRSDGEAASARRAAAVAKLVALLDRAPGTDFGPTSEPGLLPEVPSAEALRERALQDRPELKSAGADTRVAEARLRLADALSVPDLGLSVGEMHVFRGAGSPADFLFLGVQGNLPLFGGKNHARVEAARAGALAMREAARAVEARIVAELADARAEVVAEQHQMELHHRLIPLSQQAVASALASYASGRGSFTMVLDSERDLQMHELDLAMHLASYALHLADLERAVGSDIGLLRAAESGTRMSHEE